MRAHRRLWIAASLLALAGVLSVAYRQGWPRPSLRERFDRVRAGMSDEQALNVMGPPGDHKSDWRPQVSEYAEVWQMAGGQFTRREYRGIEVHTEVGRSGERLLVWKTDEAVVIVEFDGGARVCGKIWLSE